MADLEKSIVADVVILSVDDMQGYEESEVYTIDKKLLQLKDGKQVMKDSFSLNSINREIMLKRLDNVDMQYDYFRAIVEKGRNLYPKELNLIFKNAKMQIERVFCEKDTPRVFEDGTEHGMYESDTYKTIIKSLELREFKPNEIMFIERAIEKNNQMYINARNNGVDFHFED